MLELTFQESGEENEYIWESISVVWYTAMRQKKERKRRTQNEKTKEKLERIDKEGRRGSQRNNS